MQFVSRRMVLVGLAALGGLLPGVGLADNDQNDQDDRGDNGRGNPRGRPFVGFPFGQQGEPLLNTSHLRLIPVSQINGGTNGSDFSTSSTGGDPLRSGDVGFTGGNDTIMIALRGAVANSGYDVQFERLHDNQREDLGTVTTDANGNFVGRTPNGLGGNGQRAGTFVLNRAGQDQYLAVV
jgi:hypothetical protein